MSNNYFRRIGNLIGDLITLLEEYYQTFQQLTIYCNQYKQGKLTQDELIEKLEYKCNIYNKHTKSQLEIILNGEEGH